MQVRELAAKDPKMMLVASVKERGIADQSLLEFYQEYFRNPIYQDEKWKIYEAMGRKKLGVFKILKAAFGAHKRISKKGIKGGKDKSEQFIQGGLLIFDKKGQLRFVMDDNPFEEFDMDLLAAAIAEARK